MISATKGDGLTELLDYCAAGMPEGPFLYPEDQAADIPSRLLAAEITREKLYLRLHARMRKFRRPLLDETVIIDQVEVERAWRVAFAPAAPELGFHVMKSRQ